MHRWNTVSLRLVVTVSGALISREVTPDLAALAVTTTRPSVSLSGTGSSDAVPTSGHTTMSTPQITPLWTSTTAIEPTSSVSSTVPVNPVPVRLTLNAPD